MLRRLNGLEIKHWIYLLTCLAMKLKHWIHLMTCLAMKLNYGLELKQMHC